MALESGSSSPGQWEFNIEAWRRAQDLFRVPVLHDTAIGRIKSYLKDIAAMELERTTGISNQAPPSTDLSSDHARGNRPRLTHAQYAQGEFGLLHWDLTEYLWALENLKEDLSPAGPRSLALFVASAAVTALRLYFFWSSPEHKAANLTLTAVTAYHAGFALTYASSVYLVSRCHREATKLRHRVGEELVQRVRREDCYPQVEGGTLCEDDLRAWNGYMFAFVNCVASERHYRRDLFKSGALSFRSIAEAVSSLVTL